MKTVAVHVERIVVESQPGVPDTADAITLALQAAIARELDTASRSDVAGAIERAVRSAFAPAARRRP